MAMANGLRDFETVLIDTICGPFGLGKCVIRERASLPLGCTRATS